MARVPSNMIALGRTAPHFILPNVSKEITASLDDLKGENATLIFFICNHCPFVEHINEELVKLANDYNAKGIGFIAISSNDVVQYPNDGPDQMKAIALKLGYPFPYLYDETQEVAKSFDAACTPDFFLYNSKLELVYRGQLCDSRPGNGIPVTGMDIRKALEVILSGNKNLIEQKPSIGCNIKWKEA
jgi:hypothetical protein